eukprot:scaffold6520_cov32-Tisochrysis_lutea.AAC.3
MSLSRRWRAIFIVEAIVVFIGPLPLRILSTLHPHVPASRPPFAIHCRPNWLRLANSVVEDERVAVATGEGAHPVHMPSVDARAPPTCIDHCHCRATIQLNAQFAPLKLA